MNDYVKCPKCKESVKHDALVCKHCGFKIAQFRKKQAALQRWVHIRRQFVKKTPWFIPLYCLPVVYIITAFAIAAHFQRVYTEKVLYSYLHEIHTVEGQINAMRSVMTNDFTETTYFQTILDYINNRDKRYNDEQYWARAFLLTDGSNDMHDSYEWFMDKGPLFRKAGYSEEYTVASELINRIFIETTVDLDKFYHELDRARTNVGYGYIRSCYKRIGTALDSLEESMDARIDHLKERFDFSVIYHEYIEHIGHTRMSWLDTLTPVTQEVVDSWLLSAYLPAQRYKDFHYAPNAVLKKLMPVYYYTAGTTRYNISIWEGIDYKKITLREDWIIAAIIFALTLTAHFLVARSAGRKQMSSTVKPSSDKG